MKILFLCGCLEYGRDGVGDYTRRLVGELINQGCQVAALALTDRFVETASSETQYSGGNSISVFRLPNAWPIEKRVLHAKSWIDDYDPEWISFQFVSFSFHPKGLTFSLHKHIGALSKNRKLHVMLHELWLGEDPKSSVRHRILGWLQKQAIRRMMAGLDFKAASTSNAFYQACLAKIGVTAGKIIIFSNLPAGSKQGLKLYNQLPEEIIKNRKQYLIGSFFGSLEYQNLPASLKKATDLANKSNKKLLITHIGRAAGAKDFFSETSQSAAFDTHIFGECNDQDIADYLRNADFGLSTYPKVIFEKSGSVAALLNNGLPVLLLRKSFLPDNRMINWLKEIDDVDDISGFANQGKDFCSAYGVQEAAEKYLTIFNSLN